MSNLLFRSFAGGEITPEMYGRLDTVKYQTGLAKALNFTVLPHGPAARRPGFRFIAEVRDSTQACKLIPFQFSSTQTAVLEFCDETVRMQIGGASLLETGVAISSIAGSTVNTSGAQTYTGAITLGADTALAAFRGSRYVIASSKEFLESKK